MYGVFIYMFICHKNQPHLGKYTSPMDGMGIFSHLCFCFELSWQNDPRWLAKICQIWGHVLWSTLPKTHIATEK